jgi:hypothetical protein
VFWHGGKTRFVIAKCENYQDNKKQPAFDDKKRPAEGYTKIQIEDKKKRPAEDDKRSVKDNTWRIAEDDRRRPVDNDKRRPTDDDNKKPAEDEKKRPSEDDKRRPAEDKREYQFKMTSEDKLKMIRKDPLEIARENQLTDDQLKKIPERSSRLSPPNMWNTTTSPKRLKLLGMSFVSMTTIAYLLGKKTNNVKYELLLEKFHIGWITQYISISADNTTLCSAWPARSNKYLSLSVNSSQKEWHNLTHNFTFYNMLRKDKNMAAI